MATESSWGSYVEWNVLAALSNEFCQLDGVEENAIDIATAAALHHAHHTFRWSIELRKTDAEAATEIVAEAVNATIAAASGKRVKFLAAVRVAAARPVVSGQIIQLGNKSFHTSQTDVAIALWELEHPAAGFVADVRAARLERSDASGVYSYLAALLDPGAIKAKASKLAAQASLLLNKKRKRYN